MTTTTTPRAANDNGLADLPLTREMLREQVRIKPAIEAANDNDRRDGESFAEAGDRLRVESRAISTITPFEKEIREKRVPVALELAAALIESIFERTERQGAAPVGSSKASNAASKYGVMISSGADPTQPIGAEITVDARRELDGVKRWAGASWRAVELAIMKRRTMLDVGLAYGWPRKTAAAKGRDEVLRGLGQVYRFYYEHEPELYGGGPGQIWPIGPLPANDNEPPNQAGRALMS